MAGGAATGGGGLMAFAAQDLHRQLDAAQEQLVFKEQEVRAIIVHHTLHSTFVPFSTAPAGARLELLLLNMSVV